MEVITTGWMMATLLSGWIGNRGDFWLCQGFNKLHKRINENINEPANHHIQKAIRKSYLNATLLAIEHIQKQRNGYSLTDKRWNNLRGIKSYINDETSNTKKDSIYIRRSVLDNEHQSILFPKEETTAEERMPGLVQKLKDSIIEELESKRLLVELELKNCIYDGWKEGNKKFDFYKLTCAFFTQELKDNTQLSTYVQTEYLDCIKSDLGDVSVKVDDLKNVMQSSYEMYENLLNKVSEIVNTINKVDDKLENLPKKTAKLILEGINSKIITQDEITISDQYQIKLKTLKDIDNKMASLRTQIESIENAIVQVNEDTKIILRENISHLKSQLIIIESEKDEQENKLNEFVTNVISLAKQLKVSKELDSERLKKARTLFAEAKYKELSKILNENDIDKDIKLYKERGEILANEITIKAQAVLVNKPEGWFEETDRLYNKAIAIIENYNTTSNYAHFLHAHRQTSGLISLYEKAVTYCSDDAKKISALNSLGEILHTENKFEKAQKTFQEALRIGRKSVWLNPELYLYKLSLTLNSLGRLLSSKNEFKKAQKTYEDALIIDRKLAKINMGKYSHIVASTLDSFANLLREKKEYEKAQEYYQESLEIYRNLEHDNPKIYLFDVASVLNNFANLLIDKKEYNYAKKLFQETLEIYQKLARENPKAYLYLVPMTLNNFANLLKEKKEYGIAQEYYKKALDGYRKLAKYSPEIHLSDVALVLNNLGVLQGYENKYVESEKSFQEALEIYQKLRKENVQVYLIRYADVCIELSMLYQHNKVDKGKSIFYAKNSMHGYSPYIPHVPHAIEWSKAAEEILAYWKTNS